MASFSQNYMTFPGDGIYNPVDQYSGPVKYSSDSVGKTASRIASAQKSARGTPYGNLAVSEPKRRIAPIDKEVTVQMGNLGGKRRKKPTKKRKIAKKNIGKKRRV